MAFAPLSARRHRRREGTTNPKIALTMWAPSSRPCSTPSTKDSPVRPAVFSTIWCSFPCSLCNVCDLVACANLWHAWHTHIVVSFVISTSGVVPWRLWIRRTGRYAAVSKHQCTASAQVEELYILQRHRVLPFFQEGKDGKGAGSKTFLRHPRNRRKLLATRREYKQGIIEHGLSP